MSSMEAQFPPRLGKTTMLDTQNSVLELEVYENPGTLGVASQRSSKQLGAQPSTRAGQPQPVAVVPCKSCMLVFASL
jgi:hypothetical protein